MQTRASTPQGDRAFTHRTGKTRVSGAGVNRAAPEASSVTSQLTRLDLKRSVSRWLADGKAQGWSPATLKGRGQILERFAWWLEHVEGESPVLDSLSPSLIRTFLAYLRDAHPTGRWGTDHHGASRETRPSTVHTYYRALRAFANFCLAEGLLQDSPLRNVKPPRVPTDQVQPFSLEQVQALMDAARRGKSPEREVALVLVLVDTGLRAAEICSLTVADADRGTGELSVVGKGNKRRQVYMGVTARRSLWRYQEAERRGAEAAEPLFVSIGGNLAGGALTPSGLHSIVQKLGKVAGLNGVRCSPHTLRHTFAVNFLRSGGNLFELQQLMGHTDLTVLRRYVALAEADLAQAHRNASPADRMRLR